MSRQIERQTIDGWPVSSAGLPARVVHRAGPTGIATVGDLRLLTDKQLRSIQGIDSKSVERIHDFFKTCDELESGAWKPADLDRVFDKFLEPLQREVLAMRYGLNAWNGAPSRKHVSLHQIGLKHGLTRERIRQLESGARERLKTCVARACLDGVYRRFEKSIKDSGGAAECDDISAMRDKNMLRDRNPSRVLLLLCDCGGPISFRNGYFTTLPAGMLKEAEDRAVDCLRRVTGPQSLDAMMKAMGRPDGSAAVLSPSVTRCLLAHLPGVAATCDDRFFLWEHGAADVIEEIMHSLPPPAHFRSLARDFNRRMRAESRKGPGFILETLRSDARFRCLATGVYGLAAENP